MAIAFAAIGPGPYCRVSGKTRRCMSGASARPPLPSDPETCLLPFVAEPRNPIDPVPSRIPAERFRMHSGSGTDGRRDIRAGERREGFAIPEPSRPLMGGATSPAGSGWNDTHPDDCSSTFPDREIGEHRDPRNDAGVLGLAAGQEFAPRPRCPGTSSPATSAAVDAGNRRCPGKASAPRRNRLGPGGDRKSGDCHRIGKALPGGTGMQPGCESSPGNPKHGSRERGMRRWGREPPSRGRMRYPAPTRSRTIGCRSEEGRREVSPFPDQPRRSATSLRARSRSPGVLMLRNRASSCGGTYRTRGRSLSKRRRRERSPRAS